MKQLEARTDAVEATVESQHQRAGENGRRLRQLETDAQEAHASEGSIRHQLAAVTARENELAAVIADLDTKLRHTGRLSAYVHY